MKGTKRFTAFFLAIFVLISIVPQTVFANDISEKTATKQLSSIYTAGETVSLGRHHSLAIRQDGSLWAWGSNLRGRLGDGTTNDTYSPVNIMNGIIAVSASSNHSMALDNSGRLWAWGDNTSYKLGDGTRSHQHSPVIVMENVVAIEAGSNHSMALKADGSLWTWGSSTYGQLGDGVDRHGITSITRDTPEKIMDNVVAIEADGLNSYAITTDGHLYSWGASIRLGVSANGHQSTPQKVMEDVISVSAGESHVVAIKNDGSLWAFPFTWGNYPITGTYNDNTPKKIMENVIAAAVGNDNTWAIKSDNSLWGWGYGILGDGEGRRTSSSEPVHVMDNVVAITANTLHAMAITADGHLYAWGQGERDYSRIGDGTSNSHYTPVVIMDDVMLPRNTDKPNKENVQNEAPDVIKVFLNGTRVIFDQQPIIENGRTLVPIRAIAEAMGGMVTWDGKNGIATIRLGEKEIKITKNADFAEITIRVNDTTTQHISPRLDVPMRVINDRAFVPLRFVAEAFNVVTPNKVRVDWDGANYIINITMAVDGSIVIPAEGGVWFSSVAGTRYLSIYLPKKQAENYYNYFSNADFISELSQHIFLYTTGEYIEDTIKKGIENWLITKGYMFGPTAEVIFAWQTAKAIIEHIASPIMTQILVSAYENALQNTEEDFLVISLMPDPSGYFPLFYSQDRYNPLNIGNGYFVEMSKLTEQDKQILSEIGALEIIFWAHMSN